MKHKFSFVFDEDESPTISQDQLNNLKENSLVEFNHEAENRFCELLCELLCELKHVPVKVAVNEIAFRLNISPITARRYLDKHTTIRSQFAVVNKLIVCKIHNHSGRPKIRIIKS